MMEQDLDEFFHDFQQELIGDAVAGEKYQLEAFMDNVSEELIETGFIDGFEPCHYRAPRGMRIDGYWFGEDDDLTILVADFECRRRLETLTRTDVDSIFKRAVNFLEASLKNSLHPDVTTPEYALIQQIRERRDHIRQVNFFLLSERSLSKRVQACPDNEIDGIHATYCIWDISRLFRQRSARGKKESLAMDFIDLFGNGINCLPANLGSASYQSFLIVMPGTILAHLYEKYSARLLEQNVRTFLQARAKVNKGIRATILHDPQMFFAYNNGITATARGVETRSQNGCLQITRITDLQIVNGGQTTASLYHTWKRDKADLSELFVQMKLSVIDSEESEVVVPRISEYANTQNRVNSADFFSNHPFHIRMEGFSRRIWAPALHGSQRETKWFYERARGQYMDAQSKLTPTEKKRFKAEYPKAQMFTKTDLAKFENVFDDDPKWVNLGGQKNFVRYANRITLEWKKTPERFNELYFKRIVARAILFRKTEKLVSSQPWYNGGYRANIVAYTLAVLGEIVRTQNASVDYLRIWSSQELDENLITALEIISQAVNNDLIHPPQGVSNISEWAKKDDCWTRLQGQCSTIVKQLPPAFWSSLVPKDDVRMEDRAAGHAQEQTTGTGGPGNTSFQYDQPS